MEAETNGAAHDAAPDEPRPLKAPAPKATDERFTPEWLIEIAVRFGGGKPALDPATHSSNPTGAIVYCTASHWKNEPDLLGEGEYREGDGLHCDWFLHSANWRASHGNPPAPFDPEIHPWVWLNPPYSAGQMAVWVQKIVAEAIRGCEILVLTQNDASTAWYRTLAENCDARCNIGRRVDHRKPDGKRLPGAKFASTVWYFGHRRRRFARVFGDEQGWEIIHGGGPLEALPQDTGKPASVDTDKLEQLRKLASELLE